MEMDAAATTPLWKRQKVAVRAREAPTPLATGDGALPSHSKKRATPAAVATTVAAVLCAGPYHNEHRPQPTSKKLVAMWEDALLNDPFFQEGAVHVHPVT